MNSSSEFVILVISVSIVFLSGGGFLVFADQDCRLNRTDTTVSITEDDQTRDFETLDAQERQVFEEALESEGYVADEPLDFPDRVQRNDTYYDFEYTCFYDWTNPGTFLPIFSFLGGLLTVAALLRRNLR